MTGGGRSLPHGIPDGEGIKIDRCTVGFQRQAVDRIERLDRNGGRCHDRILAYASGINLNKSIDELVEQVRGWKAAGFKAFKVKVGKPEIEEDVERLAKVREVAGRLPIMVDANQGWDIGKAVRAINAYERFGLTWIEDPSNAAVSIDRN